VKFGPVLNGEAHIGQDVGLSFVKRGRAWSATSRHCLLAAAASSWAKAVPIQAATMRRWLLPA